MLRRLSAGGCPGSCCFAAVGFGMGSGHGQLREGTVLLCRRGPSRGSPKAKTTGAETVKARSSASALRGFCWRARRRAKGRATEASDHCGPCLAAGDLFSLAACTGEVDGGDGKQADSHGEATRHRARLGPQPALSDQDEACRGASSCSLGTPTKDRPNCGPSTDRNRRSCRGRGDRGFRRVWRPRPAARSLSSGGVGTVQGPHQLGGPALHPLEMASSSSGPYPHN